MSTYEDVDREARQSWLDVRADDDRPTLAELDREEAEANDYPEPRGCSEFDYCEGVPGIDPALGVGPEDTRDEVPYPEWMEAGDEPF